MKITIKTNECVGCAACSSICPEVFDMNDEGLAYVKDNDNNVPEIHIEAVRDALENCPTGAIVEVK